MEVRIRHLGYFFVEEKPMLDWQSKKWIKVIAVILVVTFISYDIAWSIDFSPLPLTKTSTSGFFPKITNFIFEKILHKTDKSNKPDETEVSFRSQLVPTKKYEERSGFSRLEAVREMIKRQMDDLGKRQNIEAERNKAIYNQYQINKNLYMQDMEKGQGAQAIQDQLMKARGETMEAAAAGGEFSYTMNKDGSRVNYTDGLATSSYNEPVYDGLGQLLGRKNTLNMKYDSRRLLMSYDSEMTDMFGNRTTVRWCDAVYSDDSIWWAGSDTNAGKYLLGYKEITTDSSGATTVREWSTARSGYDGKKLSNYNEIFKDAAGSVVSTSIWSDPVYDGDTLMAYHQKTTDSYGNVTLNEWSGTFENKKMLSTHSIDTQINADGTTSVTENTVNYKYNDANEITGAEGVSIVNGSAQDINGYTIYTYSGSSNQYYGMVNGFLKTLYTTSATEQVNVDGSTSATNSRFDYIYDTRTNLLIDASEVSVTEGQDVYGSKYTSRTTSEYDIISGQPKRTSSDTATEGENIFGGSTVTENHVEYIYDEFGNFTDTGARGYTRTTGMNIFGEVSSTYTVNEYEIINGQPKLVATETGSDIVNPSGELGATLKEIEDILTGLVGKSSAEVQQEAQRLAGVEAAAEFVANLTTDYVNNIMAWLWKTSTNVINCAINALKNIFGAKSIDVKEEAIVKDALLVDILSGAITPENAAGEIKFSFYSILKSAEKQGVILKGANITIDQLKSITFPAVVRINDTHFVLVTEISNGKVIYLDNGIETSEDIDDFKYKWDGNVLTAQLPQGAAELTIKEMLEIRGSDETALTDYDNPPTVSDSDGNTIEPGESSEPLTYLDGTCKWINNYTWNGSEWVGGFSVEWDYANPFNSGDRKHVVKTWVYGESAPTEPYSAPDHSEPQGNEIIYIPEKAVPTGADAGDPVGGTPAFNTPDSGWKDNSGWQWNGDADGWVWVESYTHTWEQQTTIDGQAVTLDCSYTWGTDKSGEPTKSYTLSFEIGDNKYTYTFNNLEGFNTAGGFTTTQQFNDDINEEDVESVFIKETVDGYRHVEMWDNENGGFKLWRKESPANDLDKDIEYLTWDKNGSKSLTIIKPETDGRGSVHFAEDYKANPAGADFPIDTQWIYVLNSGDKGSTIIDADKHNGSPGIDRATYYSINTETGILSFAKIARCNGLEDTAYNSGGDSYAIDGLSWSKEGLVTTATSLVRVIGQTPSLVRVIGQTPAKKELFVFRNDLNYTDASGNPIDSPWKNYLENKGSVNVFGNSLLFNVTYYYDQTEDHDKSGLGVVQKIRIEVPGQDIVKDIDIYKENWDTGELRFERLLAPNSTCGQWELDLERPVKDGDRTVKSDEPPVTVTINFLNYDSAGNPSFEIKISGYNDYPDAYYVPEEGFNYMDAGESQWMSGTDEAGNPVMKRGYWDAAQNTWIDTSGEEGGTLTMEEFGEMESQTRYQMTQAAYVNWGSAVWVEEQIIPINIVNGFSKDYSTFYQNVADVIADLTNELVENATTEESKTEAGNTYAGVDKILAFTQILSLNADGGYYKPVVTRDFDPLCFEGDETTAVLGKNYQMVLQGFKHYVDSPLEGTNDLMPSGDISGVYKGAIGEELSYGVSISQGSPLAANPLGVFSDTVSSPVVINVGTDGKIDSIIKPGAGGVIEQFVPYEDTQGGVRFFKKGLASGEEIIVEAKGDTFIIHMLDAQGIDTTLEVAPDKAFAVTTLKPRYNISMNTVVYEESQGVTRTIELYLEEQPAGTSRVALSSAKSVVSRIIEFLQIKMQQLGPGANNYIENAGGIKKIIDWLKKMGTYVINCASKALYNILTGLGIKTSLEDLAIETILSDFAAGVIKAGQTPILYTSFYSLHKVAYTKGVDLKLYNVTIDELAAIKTPVIAEVGGDHAVVINKVENGIVYLLESDGKLYEVPIEKFREDFQGFILSNKGPPGKEEISLKTPIMTSGTPLPPPEEPIFPPEPPAPEWDEGARHWKSITVTSPDGTYSRTDSWMEYEYNSVGQLIGAKGGATTWAEDIFGNIYITKRTDIYTIIAGEAKLLYTISLSNSKNIDGSITTSIGTTHYIYDETGVLIDADSESVIPFSKFSLEEGQLDEDDLDYIKTWVTDGDFSQYLSLADTDNDGTYDALNISATSLSIGEDLFGNPNRTYTINTYDVVAGEAMVMKLEVVSDSLAMDGVAAHSVNTVNYKYTDGTETAADLPEGYLNADGTIKSEFLDPVTGNVLKGLVKYIDGQVVTDGIDIFGNIYASTAVNTYTFIGGQPKISAVDTVRTDTTFLGLTSTNTAHLEYQYGTYEDPDTEREGQLLITGATGYNDTSGRDIFGSTYESHTDNTYVIDKGQPVIESSSSTSSGGNLDLFGNPNLTGSVVEYTYTLVTGKDGRTATIATSTKTSNSSSGEDIFGNERHSTQSQEIYSNYGLVSFVEPRTGQAVSFWGITDAVEARKMIVTGLDTFGNRFTTTTSNTFEAGSAHYGKPVAMQTVSDTTGADIFGSSYTTTTITDNTYSLESDGQGKYAYLTKTTDITTTNIKDDVFGNPYTTNTPQKVHYDYGITVAPDGIGIWGVIDAYETQAMVISGTDLFGNDYQTTTKNLEYECTYGAPVAVKVETITTGTNLFGARYEQNTLTTNTPGLYVEGARSGWLVMDSSTEVTHSYSEDIFGNVITFVQGSITKNTYGKTTAPDGGPIWGVVSASEDRPGIISGVDIFGNQYTTTTRNTAYICTYGIPVAATVETSTIGINLFGSPYEQTSVTVNTPGIYTDNGRSAWLIKTAVTTVTASTSEDIFGNQITLTQGSVTTYTYNKITARGKTVWGISAASENRPMIVTGSDIFGNVFTTTTTNVAYVIKDGTPIAAEVKTSTTGTNLFGSPYAQESTTINTPEYYEESGRGAWLIKTAVTTVTAYYSEDIFGNAINLVTGSITEYTYGKTTGINGATIWGILTATETRSQVVKGVDIFGNNYTTTTSIEYEVLYGTPVAKIVTTVTDGTNIFGSPYNQTTVTTNTNGIYTDTNGRKGIFTLSSSTEVTEYYSEDI
ncbi:MAG: cysteine peptidase family C39 domain-containing protein, partial [Candidatus Omnitrophota bacterium]